MANLHKTERKLPWWVRDGGLPSDWLGGRIGGNSLQSNLCGMSGHSSNTHTLMGRAQICILIPCNKLQYEKTKLSVCLWFVYLGIIKSMRWYVNQ